jgi:predicted nucleotidyltransferase
MSSKIYSVEDIKNAILPIAQKYHLKAVYIFGSYARGDATTTSDIDILVDTEGTEIRSLFDLGGLYSDLEDALRKPIDLVTVHSIMQPAHRKSDILFKKNVWEEKVSVYEAA